MEEYDGLKALKQDCEQLVSMNAASATWSKDSPRQAFTDVTFSADAGQLVIVTGKVGSGKVPRRLSIHADVQTHSDLYFIQSSLLRALMGQLPLTSGSVQCGSSVAYVPQSPWVFSSTLRQNIVFCKKFDSVRYARVLEATALDEV